MAGLSGVGLAENRPVSAAHSSATASGVEIYEHRTESGDELHTIVLPPAAVDETTADGDMLGIVVIPERDRVCRSVAGESDETATADCVTSGSTVDAYLDDAAVERRSNGNYTVE
ncbi:hypothetical protein DU484_16675 [Haloplanus rubicundus]|nr:hypothetical protein DU484_16675 [Haloplanus rubicundus]